MPPRNQKTMPRNTLRIFWVNILVIDSNVEKTERQFFLVYVKIGEQYLKTYCRILIGKLL